MNEWLSRKDLAAILGVSDSTIVRLTTGDDFPAPLRIRGTLRYPADEVTEYFRSHRIAHSSPKRTPAPARKHQRKTDTQAQPWSKYKFCD